MKVIEHPNQRWTAQVRCTCDALLEIDARDVVRMRIETLEKYVIVCPVCLCHTVIDVRGVPPIILRMAPWRHETHEEERQWEQ